MFIYSFGHPVSFWGLSCDFHIFHISGSLPLPTRQSPLHNCRQAWWSLILACFDFAMHHRPGKTMGKPDALSRRADHSSGVEDNRDITLLTPNFFAVRSGNGRRRTGPPPAHLKGDQGSGTRGRSCSSSKGTEVLLTQVHLLLRVVRSRWDTPLPRKNLCPTICQHPSEDRGSQPQ